MNEPQGRWFWGYPAVWLAAAFALGVVASAMLGVGDRFFSGAFEWPGWLILLLAGVLLAAAAQLPDRFHISAIGLVFVSLFAGFVLSGFERNSIANDRIRSIFDRGEIGQDEPVMIAGTVDRGAEPAPDGVFLSLHLTSIEHKRTQRAASGVVRLFMPIATEEAAADLNSLDLRHGTEVRVSCRLVREDHFLNPGVRRRTELLDQQGIDATGSVKSPLMIEMIARSSLWKPLTFFYELRRTAIERISETFSPQTAGIIIAAMLGDKYFLDRDTADVFRRGGTFHILVISGLHMTFIGGLVLLFVRRFSDNRWTQLIVAGSVIWIYTLAVGAEPPAVRASVMFTLLLLGRALFRTVNLVNLLGFCVLLLLAWRPSDLFNPSFQLTLVSVAAIVIMGIPLVTKLRAIGRWTPTSKEPFPPNVPNWLRRICETLYWSDAIWTLESERNIWSASLYKRPLSLRISTILRSSMSRIIDGLIVSGIVQIWMLPLLVYYFHRVPLASAVLNLFVGVFVAAISMLGLAATLLAEISTVLAAPFVGFVELLSWTAVSMTRVFAVSGDARIPIYSGYIAIYLSYFVPVAALGILALKWDPFELQRRTIRFRKHLAIGSVIFASLIGAVIYLHPYSHPAADGSLRIDFLDVGQGDSAFITFPNGETMLIDAGGQVRYKDDESGDFEPDRIRIGEFVVSEYLWERGLSRVDHIVASHADADHIQGLVDVARNFKIGRAYFASVQGRSREFGELEEIIAGSGVASELLEAGDAFEIAGVRVDVIYPGPAAFGLSENDRSLVLLFTFGQKRILFTGDIEVEAERRMLSSINLGKIDVVKVPHHGSRTSSTEPLVNTLRPEFAVIPVGRRSQFGHPHPEVVKRWQDSGAVVLTTGESGTITIKTDGATLSLETLLP